MNLINKCQHTEINHNTYFLTKKNKIRKHLIKTLYQINNNYLH